MLWRWAAGEIGWPNRARGTPQPGLRPPWRESPLGVTLLTRLHQSLRGTLQSQIWPACWHSSAHRVHPAAKPLQPLWSVGACWHGSAGCSIRQMIGRCRNRQGLGR